MDLTQAEKQIILILREPVDHELITIRKDKIGKIKRITIHREHDVHFEE